MNWSASAPVALGEIPDFAGDFGLTDAGADRAANQKEPKPSAAKPAKPKTGSYLDNDYIYFYNAGADELYIVLGPRGAARTLVTNGSAAHAAIMAAIRNKKAVQISAARVKELRAAAGARKAAPSKRGAHVHAEAPEATVSAPIEPARNSLLSNLPGWAPYAAGGVILSVIASALLLSSQRARLATLEK